MLAFLRHGILKMPVFAAVEMQKAAQMSQEAQQKAQATTTQDAHFAEQVPHGMLRVAHTATPWQGFNDRK